MNKNAIKKFAVAARNKLIASVTDKAGMLGITPDSCSEPVSKGTGFEVYQTTAGTEITLNEKQIEQRRKLVEQIRIRGFEAVVEEVAYTWFNRICAIRFMEVNDYMYPVRVRVLSSEKEGKKEPDILTMAPDIEWNFTDKERDFIIDAKAGNKLDDLFRMLFVKQCNLLHEVLPGLFEETEDYTEMLLNISFTNEDDVIRMLVDGVDEKDFNVSELGEDGKPTGQVEIIGWLYQYYNTELKDDTFAKLKKNIKISKERIPAATQLFTPDWIVRYMVENSVGRIWIEHLRANDPAVKEKETAERFGWKYYLPEAEQEERVNVKLAEIRTTYKDMKPEDITCIDPCMGSGHILIAMFDVLMDIYESAGYDKREAAYKIVENNIHGLDIDKRAYQLAYFAVMMKGRGYNRRFLNNRDGVLPKPKVYAFEESNAINRKHLAFFGLSMEQDEREKAVQQVEYLLDVFTDAREYGSILNVEECDWDLIDRFVDDLQVDGQISFDSMDCDETQEKLRGILHIAKVMSRKFDAVVTNPPYMGNGGMGADLSNFVKKKYPNSKADLSTVFMEKTIYICRESGYMSMINIPVWMFLSTYKEMRNKLLINNTILTMLHLGRGVFGSDFGTTAFVIKKTNTKNYNGKYQRLFKKQGAVDANWIKEKYFLEGYGKFVSIQDEFFQIPGIPIAYWVSKNFRNLFRNKKISDYGQARLGMATANNEIFLRLWYEVQQENIGYNMKNREEAIESKCKWFPYNKGGEFRKWYGNRDYVVNWEHDGLLIRNFKDEKTGRIRSHNYNLEYIFKAGITWTFLSSSKFSARCFESGFLCDAVGCGLYIDEIKTKYIEAVLSSKVTEYILNVLNPSISYQPGNIGCIPVLEKHEEKDCVEKLAEECIEISKSDWNSFETSWDFQIHPFIKLREKSKISINDGVWQHRIEDAFFWWENKCETRFAKLKVNEEELNRIFIDIYGLQDELTPEVEDKDVTVRKADLGRDVRSFLSYAVGCMFGRYSPYKQGLIYAGGDWEKTYGDFPIQSVKLEPEKYQHGTAFYTYGSPIRPYSEVYLKDVPELDDAPDFWGVSGDNIIPITDEEYFENDIVTRLVQFVEIIFGAETLEENLQFIADALGNKGRSAREVIRNYFLKDFYADHLKIYQKRPIYWMFDSGKENGFKALIYMHRYDADTVGRVRTDYLHKAQNYVEAAMQSAQYTIDNSSSASETSKATKAISKYTKQLAEMRIYDEAIAHIANRRIEIDLDDGVKVNYAKFQGIEVAQEGKKTLKVDLLAKI